MKIFSFPLLTFLMAVFMLIMGELLLMEQKSYAVEIPFIRKLLACFVQDMVESDVRNRWIWRLLQHLGISWMGAFVPCLLDTSEEFSEVTLTVTSSNIGGFEQKSLVAQDIHDLLSNGILGQSQLSDRVLNVLGVNSQDWICCHCLQKKEHCTIVIISKIISLQTSVE